MKNKKIKIIVASVVLAIFIICAIAFFVSSSIKKQKERDEAERQEQEFQQNISVATYKMLENVSYGSGYISTYLQLLNKYNSLGSEYVKNIVKTTEGSARIINTMKENDQQVVEKMNLLSVNKGEEHEDVYNILLEMYDNYKIFYENSIKLDFTLYSSESLIQKGKTVIEKYNRIKVMYPSVTNNNSTTNTLNTNI